MSMLAEPKRKQKFSLNPRGTFWANDETKCGQKMLEKMGWNKGKGLGKKENGRIEPVKITYKNDTKGFGLNINTQNWIPHQDDFNALLSSLNQKHAGEKSGQDSGHSHPLKDFSLELRSKTSRSKVHYQKFIRGKDISQYRKEDMDCIFGTKSREIFELPSLGLNNYNGVSTFQSGKSMSDYFSEKMKNKGTHLIKQESSHEKTTINSHKVWKNDEVDQSDDSPPQEEPIVVVAKKKKKIKKNSQEFKTSNREIDRSALVYEDEFSETISEDPNSRTLNSLDKINGVDSSLPKSQKTSILQKRKWDSHSNSSAQETDCIMTNENSVDNESVVTVKRKKKKKKKKSCLEFSEIGDSNPSHSGVVCGELIPEISSKTNNLETSVVYLDEQSDTNIVKESSLKCNDFTSSRKRKHVSSSDSTSPSKNNQTKNDTFKKYITSGLKSCLKNNITSGLKKVKKMVTFKGKPLIFEIKSSEESDSSSISDLENVSSDDDDELNKNGTVSDPCTTQLPKSDDTQNSSVSFIKKLEGDTNNSVTMDSANALTAHRNSSTVKQNMWVNNESWAVSQKLAMKLTHYKDIIKGIKNDETLATTNLLDIKGYGNW